MVGWLRYNKLKTTWEKSVTAYFNVIFWHFPGQGEETTIFSYSNRNWAMAWTRDLPNTKKGYQPPGLCSPFDIFMTSAGMMSDIKIKLHVLWSEFPSLSHFLASSTTCFLFSFVFFSFPCYFSYYFLSSTSSYSLFSPLIITSFLTPYLYSPLLSCSSPLHLSLFIAILLSLFIVQKRRIVVDVMKEVETVRKGKHWWNVKEMVLPN